MLLDPVSTNRTLTQHLYNSSCIRTVSIFTVVLKLHAQLRRHARPSVGSQLKIWQKIGDRISNTQPFVDPVSPSGTLTQGMYTSSTVRTVFVFQWCGLNVHAHAKPCAYARSNSGVQMYHAHLWSNHPGSRTHCHPHRRVSGPRHLINTPDAAWLHIRWLVRTRFLRLQLEHASVVLIGNLSERG